MQINFSASAMTELLVGLAAHIARDLDHAEAAEAKSLVNLLHMRRAYVQSVSVNHPELPLPYGLLMEELETFHAIMSRLIHALDVGHDPSTS